MSYSAIISSVLASKFDEELIDKIENEETSKLSSSEGSLSQSNLSPRILDKLAQWVENLDENQLATFVLYLQKFIKIYGAENIRPFYYSHVKQHIFTQHLQLFGALKLFLQELIVSDGLLRDHLFETYFNLEQKLKLLQLVISYYSEMKTKDFFTKICSYLKNNSTISRAIELVSILIQKQGPHLHEIIGLEIFDVILSILKTHENPIIITSTLSAFVMLLPHISAVLPPMLDDLFFIFQRTLCWRQKISINVNTKISPLVQPGSHSISIQRKNSVEFTSPTSISPTKNNTSGTPTFPKMDSKQLNAFLVELRKAHFYSHSIKKMDKALQQLLFQKEWISKEDKSNMESFDPVLIDELNTAIHSLKQFIASANELPLKLFPPKIVRNSVVLYFQHLYGMFPYMFFQYLNTECQINKYFKDLVTPLLKHVSALSLFMKSQENELSTVRWLNREPQQILTECTIDIFLDYPILPEDVWKVKIAEEKSKENENKNPKVPILPRPSSFETSHLQKRISGLETELAVERYLSGQYLKRIRDLHKTIVAHEADNNQKQSLHDMIHDQHMVIRGLKDSIFQQQNEFKILQDKSNKWIKELEQKVKKLTERNKEIEEEKQILEMKLSSQEDPSKDLQNQLNQSLSKIFELDILIQDLSSKISKQDEYKRYIDALHIEILTLRQQKFGDSAKIEDAQEYINSFKLNEEMIQNLNNKIKLLTNEINECHTTIKRNEETILQLEAKLNSTNPQIEKFKEMVKTLQISATEKLKISEEKIQIVQQINVGLEKRILELESHIGELKAQLPKKRRGTLDKNNNNPTSSLQKSSTT